MTRKTITSGLIACILFLFFTIDFASPYQADACSIQPTYNYWFSQSFEFDPNDLPPGVELEISYEYNPEGYFSFRNSTDKQLFLGLSNKRSKFLDLKQGDIVGQKFLDINAYPGTGIEPNAILPIDQLNGESPFEIPESVPEPITIDLILFHDLKVYRVPMTVSFSENLDFNPRMLYGSINAQSINNAADVIFTGAALSKDNETENGFLYGDAVITVGSWLKGDGDEQVTFGYFGDGADCGEEIQVDQAYIFFVNENGSGYRKVDTRGYTTSLWGFSPENVQSILEEVGQEPISFEFEQTLAEAENGVLATSFLDTPIIENFAETFESEAGTDSSPGMIWLASILLVGILILLFAVQFRRKKNG